MRSHVFCGTIAILAAVTVAGCAPYYGYGYGPYGYARNGAYGYDPYTAYPPPPPGYTAPPAYAAPPAYTAPPAYAAPRTLSQASTDFVVNTALGESYEIEAGSLAQQRSGLARVRQYGAQMIEGNTILTRRLGDLLQNNGTPVTIPAALDAKHQAMIDELNAAQGPEFDRRFAAQQVAAHQDTIALLQNYAQTGDNPALRQYALRILPIIQGGLRLAASLPGAPAVAAVQYTAPAVIYSANCHKGLLWPFVREPGDCPTDAERIERY